MALLQRNKKAVLNTLFLWGIALFHVYIFFHRSSTTVDAGGMDSVSSDFGSRSGSGGGGCPLKFAKSFFSSQSSLIANSLFSGRPLNLPNKRSEYVKKVNLDSTERSKKVYKPRSVIDSVRHGNVEQVNFFQLFATLEPITSTASVSMNDKTSVSITEAANAASSKSNNKQEKTKDKKKKKGGGTEPLEVVVLGLSHHNAKVEVREKLAIPEAEWNAAAELLCEYPSIREASVLSTCNRFEIYVAGKNQYEVMRDAIDFLYQRASGSLDFPTLRQNLFMLSGEDAIWHLLRVSAGLDSLVVGEGQILSQVKRSYEHCIDTETGQGGKIISRLLNTATAAGKRVRSETGISRGAVSISSAAAEFTATKLESDCKVQNMHEANIAIIGAGKMARLLLVHLQTQGVDRVTIINRSIERVLGLQEEFPDLKIDIKLMDEMWSALSNADVVYPASGSTTTLIDPTPLKEALQTRERPGGIQFVDISVPRNVHPDCEEIDGVYSYNVDDLKAVVQRNTAKRRREMLEAELILQEELERFRLWQQSLGAIPTIARLQEKAENLRTEEMKKAANKLSQLSDKDLEVVNKVTKGIVAKLLHGPMSHLRQQTEGDATRAAIEQVQRAFQLEELSK